MTASATHTQVANKWERGPEAAAPASKATRAAATAAAAAATAATPVTSNMLIEEDRSDGCVAGRVDAGDEAGKADPLARPSWCEGCAIRFTPLAARPPS